MPAGGAVDEVRRGHQIDPRLGIVTGLADEARCLRVFSPAARPAVRCLGPGPTAASAAADELLRSGCQALLSFGVAGGIDPALRPGDLLVAEAVVTEDGEMVETDPVWRDRLVRTLSASGRDVRVGRVAGSDGALATPADKAGWPSRFGARLVDMESHAVARAAQAADVPVMALRAVVDPADQSIPEWLGSAVDAQGRPRLLRVAAGLAMNPGDLSCLLALGRGQARALAALRHAALDAGPAFALA